MQQEIANPQDNIGTAPASGQDDSGEYGYYHQEEVFFGPLPAPEILAKYDDIAPGAVDRIIRMAEEQARHRQYIERKQVDTEARDSLLGILSAVFMGIGILISGTVIAILVPGIEATVLGTVLDFSGVALIIKAFVNGTSNSWKNNKAGK